MVTTHLGKYNQRRIDRIRDQIYDCMMTGGALINTEVLFYVLHDKIGLDKGNATYLAIKVHGEGRKINSKTIEELLAGGKDELERRQVTQFIKRHMKSSRIEIIDEDPYVWQMNGFSRLERPYIAGYSCPVRVSYDEELKSLNEAKINLRREIQQRRKVLKQYGTLPEVMETLEKLQHDYKEVSSRLTERWNE